MSVEALRPRDAAGPLLAGAAAAYLTAVELVRLIRPALLLDPEPSWALARLLLDLAVLVAASSAAGAVAAAVFLWGRSTVAGSSPKPLPLLPGVLTALAAAGFLGGVFARFVSLDRIPWPLFQDDLTLIAPALELHGSVRDFSDSIRPAPYGVLEPFGSVGVLYLELYRASLLLFGTNVFGVRFLCAFAGVLSLGTALLVARELLPRGGGTLAVIALSGMRWHLILSRWGWNMIVLAPLVDLATLFVLRGRRRQSLLAAAGAGTLLGIGTHVYLASWVAVLALLGLALWPSQTGLSIAVRLRMAGVFLAAFLLAAAPLFLLRSGRVAPYFVRAGQHNVLLEIRRAKSLWPLVEAAADVLASPWFVGDPEPRHDLSGKSRLGWILGIPAAAALATALRFPRREFSAYLFAHSGVAFTAAIVSGEAGNPNSFRFGYLSTVAAVVSAGGILLLVGGVAPRYRRAAAIGAIGLLAINCSLSARDVLVRWSNRRDVFRSFNGEDTLLARSAIRWERYGAVALATGLGTERGVIAAIRRFRLDPEDLRLSSRLPSPGSGDRKRSFRIVPPGAARRPGEHLVERVRDPWGADWAAVLGTKK
jgi:Dolichyl-phosphate-mannose-protein mannosyltransferase